jgi:hypothetical protein
MQQIIDAKAISRRKNLLGNTRTRQALSEIENENRCTQFEEQIQEGFAWQIREAQGSAVRQSLLCYDCSAYIQSMRPKRMAVSVGILALLND